MSHFVIQIGKGGKWEDIGWLYEGLTHLALLSQQIGEKMWRKTTFIKLPQWSSYPPATIGGIFYFPQLMKIMQKFKQLRIRNVIWFVQGHTANQKQSCSLTTSLLLLKYLNSFCDWREPCKSWMGWRFKLCTEGMVLNSVITNSWFLIYVLWRET